MPTVQQMIELSDTLTKTQTRIFEYMLNHPEAVCYDTLRNTAERIGVTEVSVLKVCRKLGCSGYAEMKEVFRHYVGYTLETVDDRSRSDRGALLRSMFEAEQQGITALAASIGEEQIFDCAQTLMNAREVLLFGHDVSKVMADYFAHRTMSRYPTWPVTPPIAGRRSSRSPTAAPPPPSQTGRSISSAAPRPSSSSTRSPRRSR